jgi:cell division septum initiation protein DivIVA
VVFDTAMRGYERGQVDRRVQDLVAQLRVAVDRAETAERELAQAVDDGHAGFGGRIEKMLRIAEREADELRKDARREAAEILQQARSQAQAREYELDKTLAAGQAELDQRAAGLRRDLQAHQKAMTEELTAAREHANSVRDEAAANATAVLTKAQDQARATLLAAENAAEQHHDWIHNSIDRLVSNRDGLSAQLIRLREALANIPSEIQDPPADDATTPATATTTATTTATGTPAAAGGSWPEIVRLRRPDDSPPSSALPRRPAHAWGTARTW